jgi:predicted TIM-barrel fold metal-dependent hydrolase
MDGPERDYLAIDADGHVIEGDELFRDYLDPKYRGRTEGNALDPRGVRRLILDGEVHPPFPDSISIRKPMAASDRIKVLDKERVRAAVLFPSGALVAMYACEALFAQAVARAYNDWIVDYVAPHKDRMHAAALVSLHDPEWAAAEAKRAVAKGCIAVAIRPNPCEGRTLDDPAYDRFYGTVQDLGVPLAVHETTGDPATAAGDRYGMRTEGRYVFNHMISHPFEQMFAALSMIGGGVCEKFPRLKIGFFEAGCSWAPYWLHRMDEHHAHRKIGAQMPIKLKPSEYFERQCMVSCDPCDETVPLAVAGIGAHKIAFATDYPHFDSEGGAVRVFLGVHGVSPEDQRKILWDNAVAFYGLTISAAPARPRAAATTR